MPEDPSSESVRSKLLSDDVDVWNHVFKVVFPKAREIIEHKFGPAKRWWGADDALSSALRTTLRQLKAGLRTDGLKCWEDLRRLLVAVASNKLIDTLRKAELQGRWVARADASVDQADVEKAMIAAHEALAMLEGELDDAAERLVFRGKLDRLGGRDIAETIEAETGERMTDYMVRELWRAMRARFQRRFPDLLDDSSDD